MTTALHTTRETQQMLTASSACLSAWAVWQISGSFATRAAWTKLLPPSSTICTGLGPAEASAVGWLTNCRAGQSGSARCGVQNKTITTERWVAITQGTQEWA